MSSLTFYNYFCSIFERNTIGHYSPCSLWNKNEVIEKWRSSILIKSLFLDYIACLAIVLKLVLYKYPWCPCYFLNYFSLKMFAKEFVQSWICDVGTWKKYDFWGKAREAEVIYILDISHNIYDIHQQDYYLKFLLYRTMNKSESFTILYGLFFLQLKAVFSVIHYCIYKFGITKKIWKFYLNPIILKYFILYISTASMCQNI